MARIVIDCRMWGESGIGRYIRNLVSNLQILDIENEYFLILLEKNIQGLKLNSNFHKVLGNFRWYGVSEQIQLPRILKRINANLVHFPHFNVPIFYKGKFVVTIHDLIHQHYKMNKATVNDPLTYRIKHLGYKKVFEKAVKDSVKILTPSEFVKKQLVHEWKSEESKIVVTSEGVDSKLLTIVGSLVENKQKSILNKFEIKHPYIFYVGNAHPHKNVEGLIEVFLQILKPFNRIQGKQVQDDSRGLQLVLSGADNYFWRKIKEKYDHKNIIYTGFIKDEELAALYRNAEMFVIPSFEEGFGIPILEAMAIGIPVVSSNAGSLKEVGGNAALYFNPHNLEDMENKINMVLKSEKLRQKLIRRGKERVKKFSWKKLAEQTLEVYQKCM